MEEVLDMEEREEVEVGGWFPFSEEIEATQWLVVLPLQKQPGKGDTEFMNWDMNKLVIVTKKMEAL